MWYSVVLCGVDINDNESGLFITTLPVVSRTEVGPAGTETVRQWDSGASSDNVTTRQCLQAELSPTPDTDTDLRSLWLAMARGRCLDRVSTNIDSSVIIIIITMWSDWTSLSRL